MPFTVGEVDCSLLKKMKAPGGPYDLMTEHFCCEVPIYIAVWLTEILNSIIELEQILATLKQGITIPVYKGGGKDPLDINSYCGITLNCTNIESP